MTTQTIEKIQTGLTANYVPYWTVTQGLKEAMQNIAYGSIKSGKPAKLYFDPKAEMWAIKDKYIGFEKRHLYIGESEQREDEDGLGTFGEGWKLFLLVMARNGIRHHVSTVSFTFWGTLEPTPHGTEVLVINVGENNQESGTRVYADVDESTWKRATKSFAVLSDIDPKYIKENSRINDRYQELWVNGVRIEQGDEVINPLNLYYSYNVTQRDLINRDRSHVNTEQAYTEIKKIVFNLDEQSIRDFITLAVGEEGSKFEDLQRGPWVPVSGGQQSKLWLQALGDLHACEPSKLLVPSYNQEVNNQAKKKGFILLDTPRKWDYELTYLGIRKADDVIDDRFDVVERRAGGSYSEEIPKTALAKFKNKLKKAFNLMSVSYLPQITYVEEIKNPVNGASKMAHYDKDTEVLYIVTDILESSRLIIEHVLPEMIVWKYKAKSTNEIESAYQDIIFNLMGLNE